MLSSPEEIFLAVKEEFFGIGNEICMVVGCDQPFKEIIGVGEKEKVQCSISQFFAPAFKNAAKRIAVVHNHPDGALSPSKNDLISTKALMEAAAILGLTLVDHLIVCEEQFISMYTLGHIPQREVY